MDLARHPLALVEHTRLASLGDELGVKAGVLLQRRLELGHGLEALLADLAEPLASDEPEADGEGLDGDHDEVERH